MTWHYCIIRKTTKYKGKTTHHYDIHEVYLDKKGKIETWTADPVDCNGFEEVKTVQIALSMMLTDALRHPVMEIRKGKLIERSEVLQLKHDNVRPTQS